jgi:hypothetical protein
MDTSPDAAALRYLRYLALREGGYTRRGVPGWALREDVERATRQRLPERLPRLHARGLLDRDDVRAPRLARPVWIYRVTRAGADLAAELAHLPRLPVLRPLRPAERATDAAIHVPAGAAVALGELRRAMEMRAESPHLPGEPGWRTLEDLAAQPGGDTGTAPRRETRSRREPWDGSAAEEDDEQRTAWGVPWAGDGGHAGREVHGDAGEAWDPPSGGTPRGPGGRTPLPADLAWLVRAGLAQRWMAHPSGRRAVPLYRATAPGCAAVTLEWRDPR